MTTTLSNAKTAKTSQRLKTLYLMLAILSVVISWGIFLQFLLSEGASFSRFFQQSLANPVAALLSSDILLSAPIFFLFASVELKRLGMPANRLALYILGTFSVGVCFGLSLFLYQREAWIARQL